MTLSISFSGGSWLGMCYYLGCMSYIINHMSCENIITLGASAGSWAAFGIQLKEYMDLHSIPCDSGDTEPDLLERSLVNKRRK